MYQIKFSYLIKAVKQRCDQATALNFVGGQQTFFPQQFAKFFQCLENLLFTLSSYVLE